MLARAMTYGLRAFVRAARRTRRLVRCGMGWILIATGWPLLQAGAFVATIGVCLSDAGRSVQRGRR
jgi:hypothetical protein